MVTDPAQPAKCLSYAGILAVAANTMNGPAFTTLPGVAADAGLGLYVILIAISVAMASFVCRRMVYAMWSSLDSNDGGGDIDAEKEGYHAVENAESGLALQSLAFASSDSKVGDEVVDEIIPIATDAKEAAAQLHHREGDHHEDERLISPITSPPQNQQPLLEKTSIVGQSLEAYGSSGGYYAALAMVASALCLALAQMMLCAGVVDEMFVALGGKSCAIGWPTSDDASWIHCSTHASMKPFMGTGAPTSLLSIGWFVAASASVAMGTVDLDDMIGLQYFLFGCLACSAVRFSYVLNNMANALSENDDYGDSTAGRMLAEEEVGSSEGSLVEWFVGPNPFQTVGPIMFNFAFIVTSPSSVCLAKKETIAYKALGMACVAMGTMYAMVGLTGASVSNAVKNGMYEGETDSNLLSLIMMSGGEDGASMLDLCIIALFGFSTVASIPVYCLLAKETLITDAGVAPLPAFLLSNVLPWVIVALTYNAAFFDAFVNWSGLLILGYTNFSMPLLLDLKLKTVRAARAMGENMVSSDDGSTTKTTKSIMVLVTASITSVIVISIANSLTLAAAAFLLTAFMVAGVKV
mmetsp:Transcript_29578/g.54145  ORF Transcript_29578/g.54145 Transcript_29578/m.54145 type:complete len:580 (-) Transcript_29578:270-2009(-)|eukprot:CAMPEP_0196145264 /NCGR_PEP_ID=MMETSP0910-20130528/19757_1 /TAXON_ID=49265 /ORGANISM="Thalassiosira rotula, Strain GSO102" /LENGTH=579 /DNA_ID=CAMNT_0041407169 /DNA_START=115 /DNA_END=1854 /DNA_ORIENTATION=+